MYKFIEHTADMGLEARAESWAAVFEEMAEGLAHMVYGSSQVDSSLLAEVTVRADDPVELLVAWLNELVYRIEMDDLVVKDVIINAVDDNGLHATLTGERFDAGRHSVERQVKSVTYHQACLEDRPDGWYARVYVDL